MRSCRASSGLPDRAATVSRLRLPPRGSPRLSCATARYRTKSPASIFRSFPRNASASAPPSGAARDADRDGGPDMVRPSARIDDPVPHRNVGPVLLLRHARASGLLHDQGTDDRAGPFVLHLWALFILRV